MPPGRRRHRQLKIDASPGGCPRTPGEHKVHPYTRGFAKKYKILAVDLGKLHLVPGSGRKKDL
jgi:hypothetical protein